MLSVLFTDSYVLSDVIRLFIAINSTILGALYLYAASIALKDYRRHSDETTRWLAIGRSTRALGILCFCVTVAWGQLALIGSPLTGRTLLISLGLLALLFSWLRLDRLRSIQGMT